MVVPSRDMLNLFWFANAPVSEGVLATADVQRSVFQFLVEHEVQLLLLFRLGWRLREETKQIVPALPCVLFNITLHALVAQDHSQQGNNKMRCP